MVKVYKHTHRFDDPPSTVLLAFYLRYPNPFAQHVLSCDVISRNLDPVRGSVITQRLILKKGIVPRWARTWLENWGMMGGGGLEAWVLEESEVTIDASTGQPHLTSMTRNISHKKLIHVAESAEFHPAAGPSRGTAQLTTAYVSSNFGSGSGLSSLLRGRIEQYGASRFERNAKNAREGMSLILSLLRNYEPLPQTLEAEVSLPANAADKSSDPEIGPSVNKRSYGYNYATRRNVSSVYDERNRPVLSAENAGGWSNGRRFRYDASPDTISPTKSFLSPGTTNRTPSPTPQATSMSEDTMRIIPTEGRMTEGLDQSEPRIAPASFFMSARNPGLYRHHARQ